MVAAALGAAQNFELSPERSVAGWIGGTVDAHHRPAKCAGQVERAGVAGNGQGQAASESNQLGERAGERCGRASGLAGDDLRQRLLAGTGIDQHAAAALNEPLRHGGIALRGPALGAPSGAGIDEHGGAALSRRQDLVGPGLGGGVHGQPGLDGLQRIAGDGRDQLYILLDHVRAPRGHALTEEPARRCLSWISLADHPAATRQPRQQRRADGPLQVDHRVVLAGPKRRAQSLELLAGLAAEGSFAPVFGGGKMQVVDQRL